MTTQENDLLLEVARRMREVLLVETVGFGNPTGRVYWRDPFGEVTQRELLSVAAEFEKTMSETEHETYRTILWQLVEESDGDERIDAYDRASNRAYISASFVQRAQAWLKLNPS